MITKKIIADKLLAYLQHCLSLAELVHWAEQNLMNGPYYQKFFITAWFGRCKIFRSGMEGLRSYNGKPRF